MLHLVADDGESSTSDRARAAAAERVRDATGVRIDETVGWTESALVRLGCSADLAADVAGTLEEPTPPTPIDIEDEVPPAIDVPSPAIAGLSPIGGAAPAANPRGPERRGLRRWTRAGRAMAQTSRRVRSS